MIDQAILTECHALALTLAPELSRQPLYVLGPDVASEWYPKCFASGVAHIYGNVLARPHLESTGVWCGPGPVVALLKHASRNDVLATMVHELAHVVPCVPCVDLPPTDLNLIEAREEIALFAPTLGQTPGYPKWMPSHGRGYVRTLVHLWWRMAVRCHHVFAIEDLMYGPAYDLPPLLMFLYCLGGEPTRMMDASFSEILSVEPPREFGAIWDAGLEYWQQSHPNENKKLLEKSA